MPRIDALAPLRTSSLAIGRQRPQYALTPEEEESLLWQGTKVGLSGFGAVGNFLDLPGSTIRDIAAGENPLDQWLPWNWFRPEGRVTGRELNRKWGLAGRRDTWGNWFGGLGTEIALDPLTSLPFGMVLNKAGRVAQSAGLLDDATRVASKRAGREVGRREAVATTRLGEMPGLQSFTTPQAAKAVTAAGGVEKLNALLGRRMGGGVGFALPLATTAFGTAEAKHFARGLDIAGSTISRSYPGRLAARLFHAPSMGRATATVQEAARRLFRKQTQAGEQAMGDLLFEAEEIERLARMSADDAEHLRAVFEGVDEPADAFEASLRDRLATLWEKVRLAHKDKGIKADEILDDLIDFMARRRGDDIVKTGWKGQSPLSALDPDEVGRKPALKGFSEGTRGVNRLFQDPKFQEIAEAVDAGTMTRSRGLREAETHIAEQYGDQILPTYFDDAPRGEGPLSGLRETRIEKNRYGELAAMVLDNPEYRANGIFTNHWISDALSKLISAYRRQQAADTIYDVLAEHATEPGVRLTREGPRQKTIGEILGKLGLDSDRGAYQVLKRQGKVPVDLMDIAEQQEAFTAFRRQVVPEDIADDLVELWPAFRAPPEVGAIGTGIRSLTALFKAGVLTWPARYTRDLMSGTWRNLMQGKLDIASFVGAHNLLQGRTISWAGEVPAVQEWLVRHSLANTPENATRGLRHLYAQYGPGGVRAETDIPGMARAESDIKDILDRLRGRSPSNEAKAAARVMQTAVGATPETSPWKFWQVRGWGDRTRSAFGLTAAGDMIGRYTDDMNRLAPFLNQLKKGVDPSEAMRQINWAQVNYDPRFFTPTERQLKLLLPFYSFSSRQLPYLAMELARRPGGRLAQTIRTINRARGSQGIQPEYLSETASIPLGKSATGSDRYLTGFGFMFEDPLAFIGGPRQTGLEIVSRMNPLVKAPLEWAFGRTAFQKGPQGGRNLGDLDPSIARTISNLRHTFGGAPAEGPATMWAGSATRPIEFMVANSPLARLATTTRTMTDPRKQWWARGLHGLTGIRLSDVPERTKDALIREELKTTMRGMGAKSFEKVYFPDELMAGLSAKERAEAERAERLMHLLSSRAKRRKAQSQTLRP